MVLISCCAFRLMDAPVGSCWVTVPEMSVVAVVRVSPLAAAALHPGGQQQLGSEFVFRHSQIVLLRDPVKVGILDGPVLPHGDGNALGQRHGLFGGPRGRNAREERQKQGEYERNCLVNCHWDTTPWITLCHTCLLRQAGQGGGNRVIHLEDGAETGDIETPP